ncbi:MAG: phage tail tape measure protein [Alphaproteobacteria bacterium]|nr:phage tail tape measure protein [Alphaproteobacteria bacterium]
MSDPDFGPGLDKAAAALNAFAQGPVVQATGTIEAAVTKSFDAVARTIARAAASGKLSIDQLVEAVLADFERIAISQFITKPLENLVGSIASSFLPVAGALAQGGPVAPGETYLVGEQGPELFTPSGAGTITSNADLKAAGPRIVVNVQTADAASFLKSQSQIAAMMSRALARGQRNL